MAKHIGELSILFEEGQDEQLVFNLDETHFIIDHDNGRALGFLGESTVNYAEVSNGTEGFTVVPLVRGGVNACIESVFVVFKNQNANYPIMGVPDDLENISYRTGKKGWMDRRVFREMIEEPRFISEDDLGRPQIVFLDNVNSHGRTNEVGFSLQKSEQVCHIFR